MIKIEELKKRKDGLDVLADIYRYAKLGNHSISPEDEPLFRWYGIYSQRPIEDGFFMVRLRIPGGDLTPVQLRKIAELCSTDSVELSTTTSGRSGSSYGSLMPVKFAISPASALT